MLNISNELAKLSDEKVKIITLRDEDIFVSIKDHVKFINKQKPELMLSLHCNTAPNSNVNGLEAYYYDNENTNNESMKYSTALMYEQLEENFSDCKMKTANFKILKDINCTGILIEIGFLLYQEDKNKLNSATHQHKIAKAIYDGLLKASKIKI